MIVVQTKVRGPGSHRDPGLNPFQRASIKECSCGGWVARHHGLLDKGNIRVSGGRYGPILSTLAGINPELHHLRLEPDRTGGGTGVVGADLPLGQRGSTDRLFDGISGSVLPESKKRGQIYGLQTVGGWAG